MRRILAITLLIAFGSPLVLPLLASTPDLQRSLPACCRRNGAHHCNAGMLTDGTSPAFKASPCPNYPTPGTPVNLNTTALATPRALAPAVLRTFALATATWPQAQISILSANLQRGPPTLLA
jgi:hypothetical protein